jgi:hypothetical protein
MNDPLLSGKADTVSDLEAARGELADVARTVRELRQLQEAASTTGAGPECDRLLAEALHAALALGAVAAKHYRSAVLAYVAASEGGL